MHKVIIYGAGSIGNHLAHSCRQKDWEVTLCDTDPEALSRTKKQIYPQRYGAWDDQISLHLAETLPLDNFELVIIGTPPDTHLDLAIEILERNPPRVLLIEKPLCPPSLEKCNHLHRLAKSVRTFVFVGYNHCLTPSSFAAETLIKENLIGIPKTLSARFREYWGGIFSAHPWLDGPKDSYLGFSARGGGAGGEHSHAIHIWQHFSYLLQMGKIEEVSATLEWVEDGELKYDSLFQASVRTENGLFGNISQDVITEPPEKCLRVQGTKGHLEWSINSHENEDSLKFWGREKEIQEKRYLKTRPDDFKGEIDHIELFLDGKELQTDSPISLESGLDVMMVLAAAHASSRLKKKVKINYNKGYCLDAIEPLS